MLLAFAFFWYVQFADKAGSHPVALSARAVEQREQWHIVTDSLDYAVVPAYVDSLRARGARVCHVSRWMNSATVEASEATAASLRSLPFVTEVTMTRDHSPLLYGAPQRRKLHTDNIGSDYAYSGKQLSTYNLLPLHEQGYEGQGIRIAVIDGSFAKLPTLGCFDYVRQRIIGAYSFVDDDTQGVYDTGSDHGVACLSTIAAKTSNYHGAATEAEYVVIQSEEDPYESPKEPDNLVAALELCDSLGVNIVSISLGYAQFDNSSWSYTYQDMDGRRTRASRAATIAARKGMLLCVAIGNEGTDDWRYLSAPADADSILTVGAVDTDSLIGSFSSYGPSWDDRIKPEVCAVGVRTTVYNANNVAYRSNGTSFACPLIAGMAACVWSALPDENAMQIRERIIRSADRYAHPDDHYGYGIPNAWAAYQATPTNIQEFSTETPGVSKMLRHGRIVIIRDGRFYDLTGVRVF